MSWYEWLMLGVLCVLWIFVWYFLLGVVRGFKDSKK